MNLSSKNKIYLTFSAVAALVLLFSFVVLNQGERIKWHSTEIETNWLPGIESINLMRSTVSNYRATEISHAATDQESLKAEYTQILTSLNEEFLLAKDKYEPTIRSYAVKENGLWKQYIKNYDAYMLASKKVIAMSQNNEKEKALNQIRTNEGLYNSIIEYSKLLVDLNSNAGNEEATKGNEVFDATKVQLIGGVIVIMLVMIIMGFLLSYGEIKQKDSHLIVKARKNVFYTFFILSVILVIYSGLMYQQLNNVNEQINSLKNKWLPSILYINSIGTTIYHYRNVQTLSILTVLPDEKVLLENKAKLLVEDIDKVRNKLIPLLSSDAEKNLYKQFTENYDEYMSYSQRIADFSHHNEIDKALIEDREAAILQEDFSSILVYMLRLNERGGIMTSYQNDAALESLVVIILGGVTSIILFLIISAQLVEFWLLGVAYDTEFEKQSRMTLTIKLKLRLVFVAMLVIFILFSLLINGLMKGLNDNSREIEKNWLPSIIKVNQINKMVTEYGLATTRYVFTAVPEEKLFWDKTRKSLITKIAYIKSSYAALISSEQEDVIYQDFSHNYMEYLKKSELMLALSDKNDLPGAIRALQVNNVIFDAISINLEKLVQLNAEGGEDATKKNNQIYNVAQQIVYSVVLIILAITILFMIIFDKNISVAIQRLTNSIKNLSVGVLSTRNDDLSGRHDEIGQMSSAVDKVNETLQALTIDANELIHAAEDSLDSSLSGMSAIRIDSDRHPGEFNKIVSGMNNLIEVMSKPLGDIAEIMQNLALGDLSGRMQGDYAGELYTLKSNVNRSLEALVGLLTELSQTMQYMAGNDLTHNLTGNYQGEFSLLKASTNQTIGHMIEILQEITISTSQSAVAIAQTSESSKYVADEASQQMFAIENVSKTIDETAESVSEIAQKAQEGSQLACSTANFASDGQVQLNKLIDLIQHIDAEYVRIEKITDEITRIADKTHLLSLNAGLEAMRAGEYGLGFGFVAQQIGALSEEVTASANSIGSVINSSGQKIRLGVHAMQETQVVMAQIAHAAQASEVNVQSISVAIVQQSAAVKAITDRINELRISSGATASAAEEISSTMNHLAQTVKETADKVKRFKLIENKNQLS
jgi:methyl-accepting chemotaxis protein